RRPAGSPSSTAATGSTRPTSTRGTCGSDPTGGWARSADSGRGALDPGACEHVREELGRLRAGDPVALVDDEERHPRRAVGPRLRDVGRDGVGELVALEDLGDALRVDADGGAQLGEHGVVGDVAPLDEVRGQQPLLEVALRTRGALGAGEVQQPVRVAAARVQRPGLVEDETLAAGGLVDLADNAQAGLLADPVPP